MRQALLPKGTEYPKTSTERNPVYLIPTPNATNATNQAVSAITPVLPALKTSCDTTEQKGHKRRMHVCASR